MNHSNKILIIGGCGYIGEAIQSQFDGDMIIYDNLMFEDRWTDYHRNHFINGDCTDYEKLKHIINIHQPKAIIMLAGIVGDGACAANPELTQKINIDAIQWLADNYDGRIVFTSSCSVYGKNDNILSEDMEVNPLSLYAETKVKAEEILKDKNAVIFRLGTLYGLAGPRSRPRFDLVGNLLPMKAALGEDLTVFSGNQWRPMLHVRDAATAIWIASNPNAINPVPRGIYNLSHKNMNLREVAKEIVEAANQHGINSQIIESEIPVEDQRNYRVTNDKFYSLGLVEYPKRTIKRSAWEIIELVKSGRIKDPKNKLYHNHGWMLQNMPGKTKGKSSVN